MPGVTGESSMRPWHGNVHTAASVTVPMLRRRGHAMIGSMAPAVVRRTDMRRIDMHGCMTATMNLDWIKMRRNIAASVMVASIRMMGIVSEQRAGRRKNTDGKDGDKAFHRFLDLVFFKWAHSGVPITQTTLPTRLFSQTEEFSHSTNVKKQAHGNAKHFLVID